MGSTLKGHVALVTGGTGGIGLACAKRLAQEGAAVAINGRHPGKEAHSPLEDIKQYGVDALFVQGDISKKSEVVHIFSEVKQKLGCVDILVNNAGVYDYQYVNGWNLAEETWDWMMAINLKGVFLCCAAALPDMISAGWGRIINISSTSGISGGTSGVHYAASKGGVIALTKAFASETASKGITVNTIAPSKIKTKMLETSIMNMDIEKFKTRIPMGRFGSVEEIAEAVLYFARPEAAFTTGQVLVVSGGY